MKTSIRKKTKKSGRTTMSRKQLAQHYAISPSTLNRWLHTHFGNEFKGVRLFPPIKLKMIFEKLG